MTVTEIEITGTITATEADARVTRELPGSFPFQGYTILTDDGTEKTVLVIVGSAADVAFGKELPLLAQPGERVTCTATDGRFGYIGQERATGERDANGRKIRVVFTTAA